MEIRSLYQLSWHKIGLMNCGLRQGHVHAVNDTLMHHIGRVYINARAEVLKQYYKM